MPFAKNIAGQMAKKYPLEFEDARQAAYEGLVEAAARFDVEKHDPAKGTVEQHFKSFAYFRIHGSIVDECRRNSFVSRSAYAAGHRASMVSFDAALEHGDGILNPNHSPVDVADEVVAMRDALEILDEREYRIVLGQAVGMSGRELSEEYGVDESRISQIGIAARQKLQEKMS